MSLRYRRLVKVKTLELAALTVCSSHDLLKVQGDGSEEVNAGTWVFQRRGCDLARRRPLVAGMFV